MKKTVEELIKSYWNKEVGSDSELLNDYFNTVKGIASKVFYSNKDFSCDYDDYIQAGNIAIFKACEIYKRNGLPEDINASIYLYIKHAVLQCRDKLVKVNRKIDVSMDEERDELGPLVEALEDEHGQEPFEVVEKYIDNSMLRKELNYILKTKFDKVTCEIIRIRYGWYDDPKTYDYIANEMNISVDKIKYFHDKAIKKMQNMEWTKRIGVLYLYGYNIKNIKHLIEKDVRRKNDLSHIKLYSHLINDAASKVHLLNICERWGM